MKVLILTVAGMSSRFSYSVGYNCLKCLYYEDQIEHSILYRMLRSNLDYCDKAVIVGGFQYALLSSALQETVPLFSEKVTLVQNEHYCDYGSGYSLFLGLEKAFTLKAEEIVFAEGDLYVRPEVFQKIWNAKKDVITENTETILASKAVAFYSDKWGYLHYIYDTSHGTLQIHEPFTWIRNSGQIWKFTDIHKLKQICRKLSEEEQQGTNLIIIQNYFGQCSGDEYELVSIPGWINCNTVEDFRRIKKMEEQKDEEHGRKAEPHA